MELIYDIYGHAVRVRSDDAIIADAARDVLGQFPPLKTADGAVLEIAMSAVDAPGAILFKRTESTVLVGRIPKRGVDIEGNLLRDGQRWIIEFGAALIVLDPANGRAEGWIVRPNRDAPDSSAIFILMAIIELLRTREVYAVHCSALAQGGQGILFIGPGGSGKTTACISLTRAGYHCLSDDHPLLRVRDGKLEILPFPGRLFVAPRTVAWFPELDAAQENFRPGPRKRSFMLSDIAGYRGGVACRPSLLIFPRITDVDESVFEPMSRARALEELLPQTVLVMDPAMAARQFETISRLVRETPAYRLHFGQDVERLPELVAQLTESVTART
jgi:hypothetical protein